MTPGCASCGAPLVAGSSPDGLCARCLLATALAADDLASDGGRTTLAAGTTVGAFRIVRVVGRGGMSTVYEARDERLDRAVALKILPPEFLHDPRFAERFEREARVVAALEHPNIVPIYASGIDDGIPWMSMRLLTGGTIGSYLERGRLEPRRILHLLRAVAKALDYAHAHGVVHRDIKPTNVLLDGADGVFVGDFGLAYMIEVSSRMTQAGLLAGTPEYMAPEQALGAAVDHRCDIYSLSMLAYEMFTGAPPFAGGSPVAVLFKQVHDPLPQAPPGVIPAPVMRVIEKGSAKEPIKRWASAAAMVDALDRAASGHSAERRWLRVASLAAAIAATLTAGWFSTRQSPPVGPTDTVVATTPRQDNALPEPLRGATPPPETRSPAASSTPSASAGQRSPPTAKRDLTEPLASTAVAAPTHEPAVKPLAFPLGINAVEPPPVAPPSRRDGDSPAIASQPLPEVFTPPTRLRIVSPDYPQVARAAQLEGDVLLEAVVTAEGAVTNVRIIRSVHPLLDEAARKAVLRYEYAPARRNDVPESAVVRLTVSFRMP